MTDKVIEDSGDEAPPIPEALERLMLFVLEEAKEKMVQGEDLVPFSALVVKDNLFIETHPGDTVEECFADARRTVEGARGAQAYAFCYDGFVDTDAGVVDVVIAEGGIPGEPIGMAIGYLYTIEDKEIIFEEEPAYVGEAENFMAGLKEFSDYDEEDLDPKYFDDEYDENLLN